MNVPSFQRTQVPGRVSRRLKILDQRTVLVIEDDTVINDFVSRALRRNGATVLRARDPFDGIRIILESKPDVVLLDMALPG